MSCETCRHSVTYEAGGETHFGCVALYSGHGQTSHGQCRRYEGRSRWGATKADAGFVSAGVAIISALMLLGLWLEVALGVA